MRRTIAVSAASLGLIACGDKTSKSSTETASPSVANLSKAEAVLR